SSRSSRCVPAPSRTISVDPQTGHVSGSGSVRGRSEEHTSELQSLTNLVCRLLLEKKKILAQLNSRVLCDLSQSTHYNVSTCSVRSGDVLQIAWSVCRRVVLIRFTVRSCEMFISSH